MILFTHKLTQEEEKHIRKTLFSCTAEESKDLHIRFGGSWQVIDEHSKKRRWQIYYHSPFDNQIVANEAHRTHGKRKTPAKRLDVVGVCLEEMLAEMKQKKKAYDSKLQREKRNPAFLPNSNFLTSLKTWMDLVKKNTDAKRQTIDRMERTLRIIEEHATFLDESVVNISAETINSFYRYLAEDARKLNRPANKGYSLSQRKKVHSMLKQFFDYAYSVIGSGVNPMGMVYAPKRERATYTRVLDQETADFEKRPKALSAEELVTFKAECMRAKDPGVHGTKYGAGLFFILMTMLRESEACALRWRDIDTEGRTVTVNKTVARVSSGNSGGQKTQIVLNTPKTKSGIRTVPLNDEAMEALAEHKRRCSYLKPGDFVFANNENGRPVVSTVLTKALKSVMKWSGLAKEHPKFTLHTLRHTGITWWINIGAPIEVVSKWAGHSNVNTTVKIYYSENADILGGKDSALLKVRLKSEGKHNEEN